MAEKYSIDQLALVEFEIRGDWAESNGVAIANEACKRIYRLTTSYLEYLGKSSDGWDALYRDPMNARLWELVYLQSDRHGGGPPTLRCLPYEVAKLKFPTSNL
jgi:hypothetical protein